MVKNFLFLWGALSALAWASMPVSGHWKLDRDNSQLPHSGPPVALTLSVSLEGPQLVVQPDSGESQRFELGGAKTPFRMTAQGPGGMTLKGQGTRSGEIQEQKLLLREDVQVSTPFGTMSLKRRQEWKLESNDRLHIVLQTDTPEGQETADLVYLRF